MHFEGAFRHLAGKGDDLANDQLRDGATVGEGAVEDADPVGSSVGEINLVCADAEAADGDEVLCVG